MCIRDSTDPIPNICLLQRLAASSADSDAKEARHTLRMDGAIHIWCSGRKQNFQDYTVTTVTRIVVLNSGNKNRYLELHWRFKQQITEVQKHNNP